MLHDCANLVMIQQLLVIVAVVLLASTFTRIDALDTGAMNSAPSIHAENTRAQRGLRANIKWRSHSRAKFVDVVVVAPSAAGWQDRRARIREQFPRNLKLMNSSRSATLKFALGTRNISETAVAALEAEQGEHQDMLLMDCIDMDDDLNWNWNWKLDGDVSATTSKVMLSIAWAVQHYTFHYFFRLGDDSYFRVDKFVELFDAHQIPREKAVVGQILKADILGMSQEYPQGMGYGLTYDLCSFVSTAMPWLLDTAPEDGVVARWLFATGAKFINSSAWRSIIDGEKCDSDMVLAHKLPPEKWPDISALGTVEC